MKLDVTKMNNKQKFEIYDMWNSSFVKSSDYGYIFGSDCIDDFQKHILENFVENRNLTLLLFVKSNMSENFQATDETFWIDENGDIITSGSYEEFLEKHKKYFEVTQKNLDEYLLHEAEQYSPCYFFQLDVSLWLRFNQNCLSKCGKNIPTSK